MKLEVWNDAIRLLGIVKKVINGRSGIDIRLRSQILDSAQSISANIAEGYCRRSLKEYLQFLAIALGSSGELMTRIIGFREFYPLTDSLFEEFDTLHYCVENKLIALIKSLQAKRKTDTWQELMHDPLERYLP
jgi:four helix bundle protein